MSAVRISGERVVGGARGRVSGEVAEKRSFPDCLDESSHRRKNIVRGRKVLGMGGERLGENALASTASYRMCTSDMKRSERDLTLRGGKKSPGEKT